MGKKRGVIMRMRFTMSRMFLVLLTSVGVMPHALGASLPSPYPASQTRHSIHQENNEWNWQWRENGTRLEVRIRGKAEFTEDYGDLKSLSSDGSLRVIDERGGVTRRFEAVPNGDGSLRRSYWVNGEARPFNDEARKW